MDQSFRRCRPTTDPCCAIQADWLSQTEDSLTDQEQPHAATGRALDGEFNSF
jgi:hypothetical protein